MIDFHSHLIPAIDDGAESVAETRDALAAMAAQGVERVITTPHLSGGLTTRSRGFVEYLKALERGWAAMTEVAQREFPQLTIGRGAEVMLDTPAPDLSDPRVRLDGTQYVLMEFSFMMVPPNVSRALSELRDRGWRIIVAHPERYQNLSSASMVEEWREAGARLQVNYGSLIGRFGESAERLSLALLERGWIDFLSSDYHARGRLAIEACRQFLLEQGAEEQLELLSRENARRMLEGETILEVPPLERKRKGWLGWLRG